MNFVIGKSKILFLLRNAYFIIGTALPRARYASGMGNAPTGGGGECSRNKKAARKRLPCCLGNYSSGKIHFVKVPGEKRFKQCLIFSLNLQDIF